MILNRSKILLMLLICTSILLGCVNRAEIIKENHLVEPEMAKSLLSNVKTICLVSNYTKSVLDSKSAPAENMFAAISWLENELIIRGYEVKKNQRITTMSKYINRWTA